MAAADWGVQDTGYVMPTLEEVRADRVLAWKALFGDNQPTEPGSVNGRLIDYATETLYLELELGQDAYNSNYLSTVGPAAVDLKIEEYGYTRSPATYSTVTLTITGTPAILIPALSQVQLDSLETWTTVVGGTIGGGGTVDIVFVADNSGPVIATAMSTWTILTPVTGWASTANAADATLGADEQSAADVKEEIRRATRGSLLQTALMRLENVTGATVFENDTDTPDVLHSATHWVEAMVVGDTDLNIANVIALHLAPGITTFGTDSAAETISGLGETINFSRPIDTDAWIEIDITGGEGFAPADPSALETYIEQQIAIWGDANHDPGDDVAPAEIAAETLTLLSGKVTLAIRVDTVSPAVTTTILSIADRYRAAFDSARVTCTIL